MKEVVDVIIIIIIIIILFIEAATLPPHRY
jgi:hypothetical protein